MKIALLVITAIITGCALFLYLSEYKSAFEADQACHYDLSVYDFGTNSGGCDHDMETSKWILFASGIKNQPAKVIKRYKYH